MKLAIFLILMMNFNHSFAQHYGWGTTLEEAGKKVKIGGRLQGIIANESESESQDFYLRRMRLNINYKPWQGHTFAYDIRNDSANEGDEGEQGFVIGDAYWEIQFDKWTIDNFRFFRSKVDISYSQTSSSRDLFNPHRNEVSEYASDFLVHNRRANNIQANGHLGRIAYQVYLSDGIQSDDLEALAGNKTVSQIENQKLSYGGKVRYFLVGDAKDNKVQDTFYGQYDTVSIGIGHGRNDKITARLSDDSLLSFSRVLTNLELSISLGGWRFLAENFVFDGVLINSDAGSKSEMFGNSEGYFAQLEYVFGKWAPYINFDYFDKFTDEDDWGVRSSTFGINYYELLDAMRFGVAYKRTENELNLGDDFNEAAFGYMMLNF